MGHGGGSHGGGGGGHSHSHSRGGRSGKVDLFTYLISFVLAGAVIGTVLLAVSYSCNTVETLGFAEQAVCKPTSSKNEIIVTVSPANAGIASFRYPTQELNVLPDTKSIFYEYSSTVSSNGWEYYSFVVIHGSTINYNISTKSSLDFYILSGPEYTKFENDDNYDYEITNTGSNFGGFFTATEDVEYFFVLDNYAITPINAEWEFNLTYKQYDTNGYTEICKGSEECTFKNVQENEMILTVVTADTSSALVPNTVYMTRNYKMGLKVGVIVPLWVLFVLACITPFLPMIIKKISSHMQSSHQKPPVEMKPNSTAPTNTTPTSTTPTDTNPTPGAIDTPSQPPPAYSEPSSQV